MTHLPLLAAGLYQADKGQHFPLHHHAALELILYRTGEIEWHGQDTVVSTQPGMVLVTPPEVPHLERALSAYSHVYMLLDQGVFSGFFRRHKFTDVHTFFDDEDRSLERSMVALSREWQADHLHRERMIEHLFNQIVILFERLETEPEPSSAEGLVRRAERILEERFTSPPSMTELAAGLGVSSSLMRLHFAALRNYSPKGYLLKVRLNQVMGLLRGSNLSLEAIAELTGYHSSSHLSRHVRQATGKAPGAFRSQGSENEG